MMTHSVNQGIIDSVSEQHGDLEQVWSNLHEALIEENFQDGMLLVELQVLKEQLEEHFRFEEHDGYFDDAVLRAPHLEPVVEKLRRQHGELLDVLASLQECCSQIEQNADQVVIAQAMFEGIAKLFVDHEHEERMLLEEVYCRDMSAMD